MTDVIANFDRSAVAYEALARPQYETAAALAKLINPEERHGRAVEFGAGPGLFTEQVQPWTGSYAATDGAAAMVQRGRVRCPQVEWSQHDARVARKAPAADWIFACNLLQWLDEPEHVLHLWRSQMKTGGHLLVAVLVRGTLGELAEVLPSATPVVTGSLTDWQTHLTRAGFALERSQPWQYVSVYPSALNFLRAIHAMGFAPRRVAGPGRLRVALRDYDKKFAVSGGVQATWQAWLARAKAV